ncbi:MAG: Fe-S cluster protein [Chloroflexi bacterium]|nr:MAG: Fe-S cluster protein [Chloroflexota bacterium]
MLIDHYDLDLFVPPCEPGSETWSAIARLTVDISEVLPYLNATLRGAIYNQAAKALTWKKGGRTIAFHPYQIAASNLEDRDEATKVIESLVKLVNRTWEKRDEITPSYEQRQRPTPMAVYNLLPKTNCKRCGEPTCWTFALKLIAGQKKLLECPPLFDMAYTAQRSELEIMLGDMPAIA